MTKRWRKTAVDAKDLACNNRGNGKRVEGINKSFPDLNVTSSFAFIVKAVDSGNVCAFVISAEKEEILRIFEFVAQEKQNGLQRLLPSIYVVA
jgi:hypothetical protein